MSTEEKAVQPREVRCTGCGFPAKPEELDANGRCGCTPPDPSTVITDDFDAWWAKDGRFYDPDTEDVPWYDKRKDLAEYAYCRGKLVTTRWADTYKEGAEAVNKELLQFVEQYVASTNCICRLNDIMKKMDVHVPCTNCEAKALIAKARAIRGQ